MDFINDKTIQLNSTLFNHVQHDANSIKIAGTVIPAVRSLFICFLYPLVLLFLIWHLWQIYVTSLSDASSKNPLPPGQYGWPIVGETLHFIFRDSFFTNKRSKYGRIFKTHILGKPCIRISGGENIYKILHSEHKLVEAVWPTSARKLLGDGSLAMSGGQVHTLRKRAISKAFSISSLQACLPEMQFLLKSHIDEWCQRGHVLGYIEARNLTLTIVAKLILGIDLNGKEKGKFFTAYNQVAAGIFSLPINIPGSGLYRGLKAKTTVLNMIDDAMKRRQKDGCTDSTAFDFLIERQVKKTSVGILEAGLELLFAGHETTASAVCSLLLHLAKNPLVVERIHDELSQHGLYEEANMKLGDVNKLTYINCVVKEVLRLVPPIGGVFRSAIQTFELDGYQVPKGWMVMVGIRDLHETTTCFDHGNDFDPGRWERCNSETRQSFLPFSSGPRTCVGKEFAKVLLKLFIVELCRSCSWRLSKSEWKMKKFPFPHPDDHLPLQFAASDVFRRRAKTI